VTRQPHLYDDATATLTSRQATLFDANDAAACDSALTCCTCDRPMVRTESGFLCCPTGHGKLIDKGATGEPDDQDHCDQDEYGMGPTMAAHLPWDRYARTVARRHRRRAAYYRMPACRCGACRITSGLE
jgi:hypothetical protein